MFIDQNISRGNVLVHCAAGMNRSVCVILFYLMKKYQLTLSDAIIMLKKRKPNIAPDGTLLQAMAKCPPSLKV